MLSEQIATPKADRNRAPSALERIESQGVAASRLDPDKRARFGQFMRSCITEGEVPFRKAHLRSRIDAVAVDHHVVHGSRTALERPYSLTKPPRQVFVVLTAMACRSEDAP